jgi:glucose/arabinose dehydrogenase
VPGEIVRRRALAFGLGVAGALLVAVAPAAAQTVQLSPFGGQTFSSPYYVAGAPGDPSRVFVVEAEGTIQLVKDGITLDSPFLDISGDVCSSTDGCGGESGLFSMALAPDYATSGLFYVFYTRDSLDPSEAHYLRIEEFRRSATDPDLADPASRRIVFEIPHLEDASHNGGQLQFGPDALLYISVGDGGSAGDPNGNGQNTGTLLGKLLRIDPAGTTPGEYSVPADNPFAGSTPGAGEIYSYGLRNPWRFSFDRLTGDLLVGDVGQASREEIDFVPIGGGRGANFGWNCFEGGQPFSGAPSSCTPPPANHTPPVLEYPNPGAGLAAVTGGYVIRDEALPSLFGRYIYADTFDAFGGELRAAQLFAGGSSGDSSLGVSAANVVSFGEDACAHIYVAAIGGTVYRLEPTSGPFPCMAQLPSPNLPPANAQLPSTNLPAAHTVGPSAPPTCQGKPATIVGTKGNDVRKGTSANDVIVGLGGNDKLSSLAGKDLICGGAGKDRLEGGNGKDTLRGQEGKDKLTGGGGKDVCKGGKGEDTASKCEVERSI